MAGSTLSKIVDTILEHPEIEEKALDRYATAYRDFFGDIRYFVEQFYDRSKSKGFYWSLAQEITDPGRENANEVDFVKLISGLSGKHALFNLEFDDLIADAGQTAPTA